MRLTQGYFQYLFLILYPGLGGNLFQNNFSSLDHFIQHSLRCLDGLNYKSQLEMELLGVGGEGRVFEVANIRGLYTQLYTLGSSLFF